MEEEEDVTDAVYRQPPASLSEPLLAPVLPPRRSIAERVAAIVAAGEAAEAARRHPPRVWRPPAQERLGAMFCAYGSKPLGVVRGESAAPRNRSPGSGQSTTLRKNTWQKQERDMQDKMAFAMFDGEHIHSVNAPYDEDTHCHYCEECHEEVVSDEAWAALDFGVSLTTTCDFASDTSRWTTVASTPYARWSVSMASKNVRFRDALCATYA